MDFKNNKKLIVLFVCIGVLVLSTLVLYVYVTFFNGGELQSEELNSTEKHYLTVEDSALDILSTVYNPDIGMYAEGYINDGVIENIFGNDKEKLASTYSQYYKMALALYSFDLNGLGSIKCDDVSWNSNWNRFSCGGISSSKAYSLSVQDLNAKVASIFNEDLDYSSFDTSNLVIGVCDAKSYTFPFIYVQEQSVYISAIDKEKCSISKSFEVTDVTKSQDKDLVTLDVFYTISDVTDNAIKTKGFIKNHDKLYFKVRDDGSYYFYSSIMVENDIKQ